jgi:hypothetical protein
MEASHRKGFGGNEEAPEGDREKRSNHRRMKAFRNVPRDATGVTYVLARISPPDSNTLSVPFGCWQIQSAGLGIGQAPSFSQSRAPVNDCARAQCPDWFKSLWAYLTKSYCLPQWKLPGTPL